MADTEVAAAYRLNAANCVEMASGFARFDDRIALLEMARAWLRLAQITEKFGEAFTGRTPTTSSPTADWDRLSG